MVFCVLFLFSKFPVNSFTINSLKELIILTEQNKTLLLMFPVNKKSLKEIKRKKYWKNGF